MSSRELVLEEIEEHKGELVLDLFKVVKLEGFYEDGRDYFYVFRSLDKGRYHSSCVGGFAPLKGLINEEYYSNLMRAFDSNLPRWTEEELRQLFTEFTDRAIE